MARAQSPGGVEGFGAADGARADAAPRVGRLRRAGQCKVAGPEASLNYEDLSPYQYSAVPTGLPGVVNVGWLGSSARVTGDLESSLLATLEQLCEAPALSMRGHHVCGFCGSATGNGEIWIRGEGAIYASPAMIGHYVRAHRYLPPAPYVRALQTAPAALTTSACRDLIAAHRRKLEQNPSPADILVPFYSVKIYWRTDHFVDLGDFERFLGERFPMRFRTTAFSERGYFVRDESGDPAALLAELEAQLRASGRAPFECSFKLLYLAEPEQKITLLGLDEPAG